MGGAADTGGRPAVFPVDETINNANAKTTLAGGQSTGRTDERNAVNPPFRIIAISLAKRGAYQQPYRADRSACSACEPRLEHVDEPLLIVMKQPSRFILLDETRLGDFEIARLLGLALRRAAEEAVDAIPLGMLHPYFAANPPGLTMRTSKPPVRQRYRSVPADSFIARAT